MQSNFSSPVFFWPLLTLICVSVIFYGLYKALNHTAFTGPKRQKILLSTTAALVFWIGLLTILSYKGFFADFSALPPRPALAILIPLPIVLWIAFSKTGGLILQAIPAHWLVYMQSFRIFVELLIWLAFLSNKLPVQMTFEGRNLDVLTGILALPVGFLLSKKPAYASKMIVAFNVIGLLLLLNILTVAVLSMPTPIRYFMNEPANSVIAQFPFILLPGMLVPIAYSFHIFSLRKLYKNG